MVLVGADAGCSSGGNHICTVDGIIVLFNVGCIGAATSGKAAFQCGSRVDILLCFVGQHHAHIAKMVFDEIVIHKAGGGVGRGDIVE